MGVERPLGSATGGARPGAGDGAFSAPAPAVPGGGGADHRQPPLCHPPPCPGPQDRRHERARQQKTEQPSAKPQALQSQMRSHTEYLTFNTRRRQEIIDITDEVERCRAAAKVEEGMVLVSAMHISASVFVNDHESGLWQDILDWLERDIAPWDPARYRHHSGTGQDNAPS